MQVPCAGIQIEKRNVIVEGYFHALRERKITIIGNALPVKQVTHDFQDYVRIVLCC